MNFPFAWRAVPALLAAACASCAGDDGPRWIQLARVDATSTPLAGEVAPSVRVESRAVESRAVESRAVETRAVETRAVESNSDEPWLVVRIPRTAWTTEAGPGRFRTVLPIVATGSPRAGAPYRLVGGAVEFAYEVDPARFGGESGRFTTDAARKLALELVLAPGEAPPDPCELWACVASQTVDGGTPRVAGRRLSGTGWWVPSGHPRTLALTLPPDSCLRFGTAVEPVLTAREPRLAPRTFRVRLDGAVIFERRVEVDRLGEALEWHVVELPRGGVQRAKLTFEVEGPLALSSFLAPCVAPRAIGSYAARPYAAPRPDLVVFLADTFRADNLAAYGGTLGLAPELDRFAREARVFGKAWSTSTHTLPAHSTIFSGVYPHQNGQVDASNPLPAAVETLAELLGAHGYRTGAISDGVMVTESHGLAQGFEIFDARKDRDTRERVRAFLDADDGRPMFLFVQTYAVHAPYPLSPETRARLGGELRLDRGFDEVLQAAYRLPRGMPQAPPTDPTAVEIAGRLHDLYRAGVVELDALFAGFRGELAARGLFDRACLVFTSDHGESFFEHGRPFHANTVYEEELRIPLLVHGPGFEAGREERPVSLIDLGPTLCELAGIETPVHWRGRSLKAPDPARSIYAFQSRRGEDPSTFAVIEGPRKIIGYDALDQVRAGRLHAAFDLAQDPGEHASVLDHDDWPAELERAQRATLEELLTPRVQAETTNPTSDEVQGLRDLGYF